MRSTQGQIKNKKSVKIEFFREMWCERDGGVVISSVNIQHVFLLLLKIIAASVYDWPIP